MTQGQPIRQPSGPVWLFDMDNTLYPASSRLFAQIDVRMEGFIARLFDLPAAEARQLQKRYFHEHGTTLRGLMLSHGVHPRNFLDHVHDIDLSVLEPDRRLAAALAALPGRRLVFTNGDTAYATRVLERLNILNHFDAIFDIEAMEWHPKPDRQAYDLLCRRHSVDPRLATFVEDMAGNLMPAKAMGMRTVWLNNGSERGDHGASPQFIDHEITCLAGFLEGETC